MVETLDVFPTLCDLAGLPKPGYLQGVSLLPLLKNPSGQGHVAIAYRNKAQTIRTETHRLIVHRDGFAELYDHTTRAGETKNVAKNNPDLVEELGQQLKKRLGQ
jgi:iduronate 2-sulfatase